MRKTTILTLFFVTFFSTTFAQNPELPEKNLEQLQTQNENMNYRMDTKTAKEIRLKIHKYLAKYLKPERPFLNFTDLQKAGYKF
jgi:hypothetical protein